MSENVHSPQPLAADGAPVISGEIQGQRGTYAVQQELRQRGQGHLFQGIEVHTQTPVVVKAYATPPGKDDDAAFQQLQAQFQAQAGLALVDGRQPDFRVIYPLEAIPGRSAADPSYLITPAEDASPSLRQIIQAQGALSATGVRQLLDQGLQSLAFLHEQDFVLPSGQVQAGVAHGNLSLDTLLWVQRQQSLFFHLSDLALWEHLFSPTPPPATSAAQDLKALGKIAFLALVGDATETANPRETSAWPRQDVALEGFIRQLMGLPTAFDSATTARQILLRLPPAAPTAALVHRVPPQPKRSQVERWLPVALGLGALVFTGGLLWALWPRSASAPSRLGPQPCCLNAVRAVPAGQFLYTAVDGGSWSAVAQPTPLSFSEATSLEQQLAQAQPTFRLVYQPVESIDAALQAIEERRVAFAVLPLANRDLPPGFTAEIVAYDGLGIVVSAQGSGGSSLPQSLRGQLTVDQVRQLYRGDITDWGEIGGSSLPVRLYAPTTPEAQTLFRQFFTEADPASAEPANTIEALPVPDMLQRIASDLTNEQVGSIGFAPLSQVLQTCSVYPLALKDGGRAVQPLALNATRPITPQTGLCDRNDSITPHVEALLSEDYPLAYPIAVVYLQDNRLPPVGRKFADLLKTGEGQRFLQEAGFVPLNFNFGEVEPAPSEFQSRRSLAAPRHPG